MTRYQFDYITHINLTNRDIQIADGLLTLRKYRLCLFLSWLFSSLAGASEQILVAVASNFSLPMQQIARNFEQQSRYTVQLAFASSGKFYAQIVNGAPYDVFLSADQTTPAALINKQLALPSSQFTYALGALALWSADPQKIAGNSAILPTNQFNKLALANPKLAPYGRAAHEVLSKLQLNEATQSRWVQGENIAQTYQFVASGNADIGFVALSQIMHQRQLISGSAWIVPADMYQPIRQDAVLLKRAAQHVGAQQLMKYLRGPEAGEIIRSFGYQLEHTQP